MNHIDYDVYDYDGLCVTCYDGDMYNMDVDVKEECEDTAFQGDYYQAAEQQQETFLFEGMDVQEAQLQESVMQGPQPQAEPVGNPMSVSEMVGGEPCSADVGANPQAPQPAPQDADMNGSGILGAEHQINGMAAYPQGTESHGGETDGEMPVADPYDVSVFAR
ncbi:hypothetical protein QR680_016167 [Steinernema hermaphroditum]|uniref:Uncharacterized protein n=1 Tax=Steinernema hermaphroditum TaxID=289476 RepID=A0AA39LLZ9_9BILA|nr:hypothetical protein QR680_016167 [Steinernema hermaphroditum]